MREEWRQIKGFESYYKISSYGRVKSFQEKNGPGSIILHPRRDKKGHRIVLLCKEGTSQSFKVARLVAEAFVPNPKSNPLVCHKDGRKWNDACWNLEWATYQQAPNIKRK